MMHETHGEINYGVLIDHLENECSKSKIKCPACKITLYRHDLEFHLKSCDEYNPSCP